MDLGGGGGADRVGAEILRSRRGRFGCELGDYSKQKVADKIQKEAHMTGGMGVPNMVGPHFSRTLLCFGRRTCILYLSLYHVMQAPF